MKIHFSAWETPYGVPPFDKIEPGHFLPALERGMSLHEAEIDAITSNNDAPTFENVILAYDNRENAFAGRVDFRDALRRGDRPCRRLRSR